jgi:hypothetical protein
MPKPRKNPRVRVPRAAQKGGEPVAHYFAPFLVKRLGGVEGYRVTKFMQDWAICRTALGRRITVDDFAEWWGLSRAQVYRDLRRFRAVWPTKNDETPERLLQKMWADVDDAAFAKEQARVARWFAS